MYKYNRLERCPPFFTPHPILLEDKAYQKSVLPRIAKLKMYGVFI